MAKMMLPASPYDASSNSHTKSWNQKGIGMTYLFAELILYAKNDATSITLYCYQQYPYKNKT
jgi:hypothetical protein